MTRDAAWRPWNRTVAPLPVCLKSALPRHLAALMSFLGIGTAAAEGLLNWGSETLPSETLRCGSRRWKLLPGAAWVLPAASADPPHIPRTLALPAPGLALTISHPSLILPPGLPGWAVPGWCWWTTPSWGNEENTNKQKSCVWSEPIHVSSSEVGTEPGLTPNFKALSSPWALQLSSHPPLFKWQKLQVGQMIPNKMSSPVETRACWLEIWQI